MTKSNYVLQRYGPNPQQLHLSTYLSVYLSMSCLYVCLSIRQYVSVLSFHLFAFLSAGSIHLSVCLSVCLSIYPSISLSLSLSLFVHPTVCLSAYPSVRPSVCRRLKLVQPATDSVRPLDSEHRQTFGQFLRLS